MFLQPLTAAVSAPAKAASVTTSADMRAAAVRLSSSVKDAMTETVPRAEPCRASAYRSRTKTGTAAPASAPRASEKVSAMPVSRSSRFTE